MLMESTPYDIDYQGLKKALSEIRGVNSVHDLHIWSLSDNKNCMTAHLVINEGNSPHTVLEASD